MEYKKFDLKLLPNEYWWGGAIEDGVSMPYGSGDFTGDLRRLKGNQGAPLLLSSKGRYIWSEHPFIFRFHKGTLTIQYRYGEIQYGEGFGSLPSAYQYAAKTFFPFSGTYPDELNFLAPQYNTWIEMHYGPCQEKVLQYAQAILDNGMPPGVLMIDDNWMNDYGSWDFYPGRFPDPREMVDTLHAMGFRVMLWVCPYVSPDSLNFRKLWAEGFLLKNKEGEPYLRRWWNGYSALIDFSNQEAVSWFQEQLDRLVDRYGIDGFKFDAGDPILFDSEDMEPITWHTSIYPNEDCRNYALMGTRYPFNEYRESWKCGGQPLVQRLRDKEHGWGRGGLASLIPNAIAQGLMGYPYNCPDMIGGGLDGDFTSPNFKLDQELYVRYAQCAALFPIMQFSLAPWRVLDKEHLGYCMETVRLREALGPEIVSLAKHAAKTGEPILRSMEYVFPGKGYECIKDQFMLGNDILVAPVLQKGAVKRTVVFPEGIWEGDDGKPVEGPITREIDAPLSRLPWFRRR